MLLLGVRDPIIPFDAIRIGIELLGDFLDIFRFPTRDLDKRAGTHLIESLSEGGSDSVDLLEIVRLNVLTNLGCALPANSARLHSAGRTRHCGC